MANELIAPVKVLVVDDSALVRKVLEEGLRADPRITVVGTAPDPYVARDLIIRHKPDVLTLDVEMPRMDGVEFLRRLMAQMPIPVVMVSSLTERGAQATLDALDAGAVDFVTKPGSQFGGKGLMAMMDELRQKVKAAARVRVGIRKANAAQKAVVKPTSGRALANTTDKVIALGASTGGTEAIKDVVTSFPANTPGVVIVQHMPEKFTAMYAERLDRLCAMEVKEAVDNDRVMPGRILLAPGGMQMRVVRHGGQYRVRCKSGDRVSGHCPSVDVLFESVAEDVGRNAVGAIFTGMGSDGAQGLLKMRSAGARTVGQDEGSSVVYGMPKVAYERGAVEVQLPLDAMAGKILDLVS
jgi:two-component system, chemotaxis family, protein-glutamate methylesterase/glutaminase